MLDPGRLLRIRNRAAARFGDFDFLHREVQTRLLQWLEPVALKPATILDLGCATGLAAEPLKSLYPDARLIGFDSSPAMLAGCSGYSDTRSGELPELENDSLDLVWSNLWLPACAQPDEALKKVAGALRNPGVLVLATLGPDSLMELRKAWSGLDAAEHVHPFTDMHNLGDLLMRSGFTEPVLQTERLTVHYSDPAKLLNELRGAGGGNASLDAPRGLTGRGRWGKFVSRIEGLRDSEGRIGVTLELVYAQAWKRPGGEKTTEIRVPLESLRKGPNR